MATARNVRSLQVVDPVLTNLARQYRPHDFVYDQLLPNVPVANEGFQYPTYARDWFSADAPDPLKADRTASKEIDLEYSTTTGVAKEYSLKISISDRERGNFNNALRLEQAKVAMLSDRMAVAREIRLAALLRKTTNGGGLNLGATPSNNWDQDAATIESDIKTGKEAIYDATGYQANTIVIPWKVANAIALQQDIRALFAYTVNGVSQLAQGETILPNEIWGLRVVIPKGSFKATSNEGATVSTTEIWGDEVRILYVDPSNQWGMPSVANRFEKEALTVTRWRETDPDVEYIRQREICTELVTAPDMGYELTDLLS